jgi:hypothetical protein
MAAFAGPLSMFCGSSRITTGLVAFKLDGLVPREAVVLLVNDVVRGFVEGVYVDDQDL